MKKIISLFAVAILIAGCICLPVSAAVASPEVDGVISKVTVTDQNAQTVSVKLNKPAKPITTLKPASKDDALISQYQLVVNGNPQYPLTFTVDIAGVNSTSKVYILAEEEDGTVQYIEATVIADGKLQFKLDKKYKFIAVLGDKKTATRIGVSEKTSDVTTGVVAFALVVSMAAVAVSIKKVKE